MSEVAATNSSPNKRAAEDEVPEIVEPKKSKAEAPVAAAPVEVEDADEDGDDNVDAELAHLDTTNIIEGRRTRGKKVDYTKLNQPEDDDEDEDDEDAVPVEPVEGESEEEEEEDDEE